jgi:anti-anti-sigma factor
LNLIPFSVPASADVENEPLVRSADEGRMQPPERKQESRVNDMGGHENVVAAGRMSRLNAVFPVVHWPSSQDCNVIDLGEDSVRIPVEGELADRVLTLLQRGERTIVLDLARVPTIDAAGVGELVRAYNIAAAGEGRLRIANATPRVRQILERVGLFKRLNETRTE